MLISVLNQEMTLAKGKRQFFGRICQQFEEQFSLSSDQFMADFEAGILGDDPEYFDWYVAKRGDNLWDRRSKIFDGAVL